MLAKTIAIQLEKRARSETRRIENIIKHSLLFLRLCALKENYNQN